MMKLEEISQKAIDSKDGPLLIFFEVKNKIMLHFQIYNKQIIQSNKRNNN